MSKKFIHKNYENYFHRTLANISTGSLKVTTPQSQTLDFVGSLIGPAADIMIKDWRIIKEFLKQGEIGILKAYEKGLLETTNLSKLIIWGVLNENSLSKFLNLGWRKYLYRIYHLFRNNSIKGSRRNIYAHYDLSNDFFRLWLDSNMCYSSALFNNSETQTLEEAQYQKMDRIFGQLNLPQGSHILEIGCGWGAFMLEAAKRGYYITGLTISKEQLDYTHKMIEQSQYKNFMNVILDDYRNISGSYDGIVSIEMFEAVGEKYWPAYFSTLSRHLKPGGKAIIQTITIEENRFEEYRKTPDFIQLYIFPGGMLPSPERFITCANKIGLSTTDNFTFGQDYAKTLNEWLARFDQSIEKIKKIGFGDKFIKIWRFYLYYCIAGFTTRRINVNQFTLMKGKTESSSVTHPFVFSNE